MGCCMSRVPEFADAPASLADGLLPTESPGDSMTPIKLVPKQGMTSHVVAVYLSTDEDSPSFFFGPEGGHFCLYKLYHTADGELDRREVACIDQGWQSSQGVGGTASYGNEYIHDSSAPSTYRTTSASKTLTVKCNDVKCKVKKTFDQNAGHAVELDSGFTYERDQSSKSKFVLTRYGKVVANLYETSDMSKFMPPPGTNGAPTGIMANMGALLKIMKSPVALYLEKMSEEDFYLTLCVIATAHDRLIQTAQLDIYGGIGGMGPPGAPGM